MPTSNLTPAEAHAIACRRIEENAATGQPILDLGDLALDRLPESLGTLQHLRVLALGINVPWQSNQGVAWQRDVGPPFYIFTDLGPLAGLNNLASLDLSLCEGVVDLRPLAGLTSLASLDLRGCKGVVELSPLAKLTNLASLDLSECKGVVELGPLAKLTNLASLDLSECTGVVELDPLAELTNLASLNLRACVGVGKLGPLAEFTKLASLELSGCEGVVQLGPLARLAKLAALDLSECKSVVDLGPLAELTNLSALNLNRCRGVVDLRPLAGLTNLTSLKLHSCTGVVELGPLAGLTKLASLDLSWCTHVVELGPLAGLTNLASLDLSYCIGVVGLGPLAGLTNLTLLNLSHCRGVVELGPLAWLTKLASLDLSWCRGVVELRPLAGLTNVTSLNLTWCRGVVELGPLAALTTLASLDLSWCTGVMELDPLAELTSLASLNLRDCTGLIGLGPLARMSKLASLNLAFCGAVRRFLPTRKLLNHLEKLVLFECDFEDLPAHLYGNNSIENVAELVRRHFAAQETQQRGEDAECKLLVVGNGAAGKTSLVRLLLGEPHRDDEPSTHAIRLGVWETDVPLDGCDAPVPVRVNIWDFGGQDLYHETHRLFFQSGAVYLVVWDPYEVERPDDNAGAWYADRKRPLQYWIDQVAAIDPRARILVIRNKADLDGRRQDPDWHAELPRHQQAIAEGRIQFLRISARDRSAKFDAARGELFAWIAGAVATVLGGPEKRAAGKGRLAVKAVVRQWQAENDTVVRANEAAGQARQPLPCPFLDRAEFDRLVREHCAGSSDADDTVYVLEWLHRTGVVFWGERRFGDRILVDQRWAIQGIYTLLDREQSYPRLRSALGRFSPSNLARWAWDAAGYTAEEQHLFLAFMQACGLCFELLKKDESAAGEPLYVAPEYLPAGDNPGIQEGRAKLRRGLADPPAVELCAADPFLGEGIARSLINRVGEKWSRSAVLWKWGAAFGSGDGKDRAVAEVTWSALPAARDAFGGCLRVAVWGPGATAFAAAILETIRALPTFPRDAKFGPCDAGCDAELPEPLIVPRFPDSDRLGERSRSGLDAVAPRRHDAVGRYVSFSVAGSTGLPAAEARLQDLLLEKLKHHSADASYQVVHYQHEPGELPDRLGELMQEIAHGDLVLVFITECYLRSKFCMTELLLTYEHGEPGRFPKDQAKLWRLPSAEKHLDSNQPTGGGISARIRNAWRKARVEFNQRMTAAVDRRRAPPDVAREYDQKKAIEPCHPWFELLGDKARCQQFLIALANHIFEPSPLTGNSRSDVDHQALQEFTAKKAEEIHQQMTSRAARVS